jgi:NitT/TauT family transport system ATP-binding protein
MEIPMVELQGVSMNYQTPEGETAAVENLSLIIEKGEFMSLIGPSGCGKSTILALIVGLLNPSAGSVLVDGAPVDGPHPKIGFMPQRDQLFPWRTILQNVLIGFEARGKLTEGDREKAKGLLIKYGLGDFLHHFPHQLSGGMRQKAALIRTLVMDPEILLLDEPFSALDYQTRLSVSDEVWKIIVNENKTTLLVTHDISEGISMSDRIAVLSKRPAHVKTVLTVTLSGERTPIARREAPEFRHYFNTIWKELDVR